MYCYAFNFDPLLYFVYVAYFAKSANLMLLLLLLLCKCNISSLKWALFFFSYVLQISQTAQLQLTVLWDKLGATAMVEIFYDRVAQ